MNNKSKNIAKINLHDMVRPCAVYYGILCLVIIGAILSVKAVVPNVKGNINGLDMATIVFIFICGLCSFGENFKFAKVNNVTRKSFVSGMLLSAVPLALVATVVDFVINRIVNLFVPVPNLYEMCYGTYPGFSSLSKPLSSWTPNNTVASITETLLLQFFLVIAVFILGLVIAAILYRCSRYKKALVWIIGCIVLNIIFNVPWIYQGVKFVFGIESKNVFLGIISSVVIAIISSITLILISRKVQVR